MSTDDDKLAHFVRRGQAAQQGADIIMLKEKIAIGDKLSPDEITFVLTCINIATGNR